MLAADRAAFWAAIATTFFYLLRVSEYLAALARPDLEYRVQTGTDVVGRRGNVKARQLSEAEEMVIRLRGSKTDPAQRGYGEESPRDGGGHLPGQGDGGDARVLP